MQTNMLIFIFFSIWIVGLLMYFFFNKSVKTDRQQPIYGEVTKITSEEINKSEKIAVKTTYIDKSK